MPLNEIIVGRNAKDVAKYGNKGTIFLGRHLVGEGDNANMTNPIMMDVARPHVMLICGKRGSGKSYSGCIMVEEILKLPEEVRKNLSILMIDTQGIFWSMKSPNERDVLLLNKWDIKPMGFPVKVFVPEGVKERFKKEGIPFDKVFTIKPSAFGPEDWCLSFSLSLIEPLGILLDRCIRKIREQTMDYTLDDIIDTIKDDALSEEKEKLALINRFMSAKEWGVFSRKGMNIDELIEPGVASIIDVSFFSQISGSWSIRNLLVGLICRRVQEARTMARREEEMGIMQGFKKIKMPITWIIIDEAHNFLPAEGKTASSEPLMTIIKEGRQPGISCALITQRPNKLHPDAISQADLVLSHRLTAEPDLKALRSIMQTYLLYDVTKYIANLPRRPGSAIIMDDNSERIYPVAVRPRQSWHAGGTPIAITEEES